MKYFLFVLAFIFVYGCSTLSFTDRTNNFTSVCNIDNIYETDLDARVCDDTFMMLFGQIYNPDVNRIYDSTIGMQLQP